MSPPALSLLLHPRAQAFCQELQEDHLSEAEFLLEMRQKRLRKPDFPWPELASLERRIEAHVDAMHEGGDIAFKLALEAMASGDEARIEMGARVVISFPEDIRGDGLSLALSTLQETESDVLPAWEESLVLADHPHLAERVCSLLTSARPELRATAARILGRRHEDFAQRILPLLDDTSGEVRCAAVEALARLGHREALPWMERMLPHVPRPEWEAWACAALCLGSSHALQQIRRTCQSGDGEPSASLLRLLAMGGEEKDALFLQQWGASPARAPQALSALGILGIPSSVPWLLQHLSADSPDAQLAADAALRLITGFSLPAAPPAALWQQEWNAHAPPFLADSALEAWQALLPGSSSRRNGVSPEPFRLPATSRPRVAHPLTQNRGF